MIPASNVGERTPAGVAGGRGGPHPAAPVAAEAAAVALRPVPVVVLAEAAPPKKGAKPAGVIWVKPAELVIDPRYQRDLGPRGQHRVTEIAMGFDWRKFTPLIVARRRDGCPGYVVIDGQHRAAACLARGDIGQVPAWCVEADLAEQAATFLTINAQSARVPSGAMWFARAATGDERAIALLAAVRAAGVEVLKYAASAALRRAHETNAPTEIEQALRQHGRAHVEWTLVALREAGAIAGRSLITMRMVRAVALLGRHNKAWRQAAGLAEALAAVKVEQFEARATTAASKDGDSRQAHFMRLVHDHVAARLAKAGGP